MRRQPHHRGEPRPGFKARAAKWPAPVILFIKKHKKISIAIGLLVLALLSAGVTIALLYKKPVETKPVAVPVKKIAPPPKFYSPLTGNEVANEAVTKQPVTAIMLENSPDARPQSGLKEAGVVYEAVAEGGITRFLALYQEAKPGLIGPVRSVRPYYVEWAAGYNGSLVHIGGSHKALQMIRSGNYGIDLDQFFNAGSFWRAPDRYAPHNVYTNSEKLDALNAAKGNTTSSFTPWPRVDGKKVATPNASAIDIAVSTGQFAVHYDYIPEANAYRRLHGAVVHTDRELGEITPSVVVAIKVPMVRGFEDGYREQITTIGSGQAYIFQNGTVIEATWSKAEAKAPLLLKDATGKDVALSRGQTWVTALAQDRSVTWR